MKSLGNHFERRPGFARHCVRVISIVLTGCVLCTAIAADAPPAKKGKDGAKANNSKGPTSKDAKGKGDSKSAAKPADNANAGLQSFGQMIPLGSRSRGVRIPAFENGKPSSLTIADAMTRVDDNRLFSEKMIIDVYSEKKDEDMRITLKTGTYNMDNQILSSTERSRVSRSDFQIEGDGMVYDTKTAQGKMVGNVEMIIFDADSATKKLGITTGAKPEAAEAPKTPEADKAKDKQTNPEEKK